jgi:hypothetical protein
MDQKGFIPHRGTDLTNAFVGQDAGNTTVTGVDLVAVGADSGKGLTTGTQNTLLGSVTGRELTSGGQNVFIGHRAGLTAFSGNHLTTSQCVFIGRNAGDTTADGSTFKLVIGSTSERIDDAIIGRGELYAGSFSSPLILRSSSVQGADLTGQGIFLQAGRGTGSANGGDIALGVALPGTTGTTLNPITTRVLVRAASGSTVVGSNPTTDCAGLDVQTGIAAAISVMAGASLTLDKSQTWMGFRGTQAVAETITLPTLANGQTSLSGKTYTIYAKSITAGTGIRSNRIISRNGSDVISLGGLYTDTIYHRPWQRIDMQADASGGTSWWEAEASEFETTLSQSCLHVETFDRTITASGYVTGTSGAGAVVNQTNTLSAQSFGIVHLGTGTNAAGTARIGLDAVPLRMPGAVGTGYRFRYCSRIYIDTLSVVLQRYTLRNGLRVTPSAVGDTDGCYFRYADNVLAGNWQCVTRNGGVETVTDSGVAAAAGWTELRVEVNNDPAITTLNVRFFVRESLVATHTTNLPASGTALGPSFTAIKSVGTTNRDFLVDYFTIHGLPLGVMI